MNKLRELRTRYGFKQKDVADKLGTTQQTIARWETGQTAIPAAQLKDLAVIFDCSVDQLLGVSPRAEGHSRTQFAAADHGIPFGTARFVFSFGEREYPIDEPTKSRLLKTTIEDAGLKEAKGWFVFSTLNNKLVLLNPDTVRQFVLVSDDAEGMSDLYHPEAYRALESGETDIGPELAHRIDSLRQDLGPTDVDAALSTTHVVYRDGAVERMYLDGEAADGVFNIVWDAAEVPTNTFVVLEAEGEEVQKLVNLGHVAALEVPLERYLRLTSPEQ